MTMPPSSVEPHATAPPRRPLAAALAGYGLMGLAKGITGVRSFWMGCAPQPRQRVYFANHASHTDFLLLWASLPPALRRRTRPVAGADYWHASRLRRFLIGEVFNGVLVQRSPQHSLDTEQKKQMAIQALQPLRQALDQGDSLILFPEGTRNTGDGLQPFKAGLYHLAHDYPQVEFVPVWLGNLQRVMPKGQVIPLPLLCTVTFGAPLPWREANPRTSTCSAPVRRCSC